MMRHKLRGSTTSLGFVLGFVALLVLQTVSLTLAGSVSCRRDPIIWLSDGTRLQVVVTVETTADELQNILYTVHVPEDVTSTKIVYPGGTKAAIEEVVVVSDLAPRSYSIDTLVTTRTPGVAVVVDMMVESQRSSIAGVSGEHIVADLTIPTN